MIGNIEQQVIEKAPVIPIRKADIKKIKSNELTITKPLTCKCCEKDSLTLIKTKSGRELLECDTCGFAFSDKTERPENITPPAPSFNFLKRALSWLPHKKQHALIFSYGENAIAKYMKDKGHDVVVLSEPINILDPSAEFEFPFRDFDLTCCYHSLDHVEEPLLTIKKLLQHLKEDGLLVIHTDFEAIDCMMTNAEYDKKYQSYFRFNTFEKMFDKMNHQIIYRNPNSIIVRKGL